MKHMHTAVAVLLNVLFCAALLWFFTTNSYLRPYAGSATKEILAALPLLASLYANYFLLYPTLYRKSRIPYWITVVAFCFVAACLDLAIAYPNIAQRNAFLIENVGVPRFVSKHVLFLLGRNLAFNFFPFMIQERRQSQEALSAEAAIVYRDVRLLDVVDAEHNLFLIPKSDIYYCVQDGNFTRIYVTKGNFCYTRNGPMKHLEQLFGKEDFVRISPKVLLPYQYIRSCQGDEVFMKKMPWADTPISFKIEDRDKDRVSEIITLKLHFAKNQRNGVGHSPSRRKQKPIKPSPEKKETVLRQIRKQPGSRANAIAEQTQYSSSTVERCLSELRKQGLVEFRGSKKKGGYFVVGREEKVMNKS
ncbi:MAG: MarR family transcriptional regulator [Bacteroidales bacterium]|nr:MarR family transcriptional regulator [Bacteroidales bacterium]